MLHEYNPELDVRCISDSGTMYPYQVHTDNCDPHSLQYAAVDVRSRLNNLLYKQGQKLTSS